MIAGEKIRKRRIELHVKQKDLANRIGVTAAFVSAMKDWKAAARNWMRNVKDRNGGYQQTMAELPDEGDFLR